MTTFHSRSLYLVLGGLPLLSSCVSNYGFTPQPLVTTQSQIDPAIPGIDPTPLATLPANPLPTPTVVCDPFGGSGSGGAKNGLAAALTYLPIGSPNISPTLTLKDFDAKDPFVESMDAQIILNQLDVRTVPFTNGFADQSGNLLKNKRNEPLIEFFSLNIRGAVGVNSDAEAGSYEFAVLADDGAVLQIDPTGKGTAFESAVDIDGYHSSQLGCSTKAYRLTKDHPLPINLKYFQGPHYEIALMLLWRKVTPPAAVNPECAVGHGPDTFFDPPVNGARPAPTAAYNAVLAHGWSVIPTTNLFLPNDVNGAACVKAPAK